MKKQSLTMRFPEFKESFWKNLGPSLVTLGLGIGGGEYILWPFLAVQYGFGMLWGALLGITLQLFLILEISRYTVVKGESIIHGFARIHKYLPYWIIFSTLIGFGWPGFAATASILLSSLFGIPSEYSRFISILILLFCGGLLLLGKNVYEKIELLQKIIVPVSFVVLLFLFAYYFKADTFIHALTGLIGNGNTYKFFPEGLQFAVFLGAFAYSGSGGNFLLGQSFYVIEKGLGHAKHGEKIVLTEMQKDELSQKKQEIISSEDQQSMQNFKALRSFQWKEGITLFWGLGFFTIFLLMYVASSALSAEGIISKDFSFLIVESRSISTHIGTLFGILFLMIGAFAMFSVQLGAFDIMGRFTAQTLHIQAKNNGKVVNLGKAYSNAVLVQMLFGIVIFLIGFSEPLWLVVTGAVINAFAMAILAILVLILNTRFLPKSYTPSLFIRLIILGAGILYLVLFFINLIDIFI